MVRFLIAALFVAGLPTLSRAQAGASPPARLADSTFWRLVTTLSEPDGEFASDNYVSNENEWQYVIPNALGRFAPGSAYIGVGPEQNFTYIASFQPGIAFICDIRRQNMLHHLLYKALMELSEDRAMLISLLFARPRPAGFDSLSAPRALLAGFDRVAPDSALYHNTLKAVYARLVEAHGFALTGDDSASIRKIYTVFVATGFDVNYASGHGVSTFRAGDYSKNEPARATRPGYSTFGLLMLEDDGAGVNRGWLGSEAAYRIVREYQLRNLIVPVVGDFAGTQALRGIGEYLRSRDTRVGAFYVSNVEQYLFEDATSWSSFYTNVASLPVEPAGIFIRSLSNRRQVQPRRADSRLAQITSPIGSVIDAFRQGTLKSYFDLIELRDRDGEASRY